MIRFIVFIVQICVIAAVALWLADAPGSAHIVWHDTVIETSAAFLAVCVLILGLIVHFIFRLWHFVRHGPGHWRLRRRLQKLQRGHHQLTEGLVAIAAGNATEAGRLAIAARKNIGNGVASQWLQAQAAQLAGDTRTAREIFRTLAANEDSAVLGYRGLIMEAKRDANWDEVNRLMAELYTLKPATPWLSLIRMESAARRHEWAEAEQALSHAVTARLLDSASGRRSRAALRIATSQTALAAGNKQDALQAAEQATRQAPEWLPATLNLAEILSATGHTRASTRMIERMWKITPHPQLAKIIRSQAQSSLEAYRQTERLCKGSEENVESRMALAEAALTADIWGEARRNLLASVHDRTATQGVYKMLARLERSERSDERAAAAWLTRLSEAVPDPIWLCRSCGGTNEIWQPVCIHCGSFDSLDWHSAGRSRGTQSTRRELLSDD